MNAGNLDTTNLLLGIMAAVSVLEALLLIGAGFMAYRLYTTAMQALRGIEERQVAPVVAKANALMARVDSILIDVKDVTGRVTTGTERVRSGVSGGVNRVLRLVHTARAAVDGFLHHNRRAAGDV